MIKRTKKYIQSHTLTHTNMYSLMHIQEAYVHKELDIQWNTHTHPHRSPLFLNFFP